MFEHMVTMDPPQHTDARSILSRLLTPKRLKENEDFMWPLADKFLDDVLANGKCEFLEEYAKPFSMLVICDLLGVPEEAETLVAEQRADLEAVTPTGEGLSALWYSSGSDTPFVGAGIGAPQMIMAAAGLPASTCTWASCSTSRGCAVRLPRVACSTLANAACAASRSPAR